MENTIIYNPTKVFFGKNVIAKFSRNFPKDIKRVLLLYGKGSIKNNGIYNEVVEQLKLAGLEWVEYSGVKSNPIIEDVYEAVNVVKKNKLQAVVAVGGGSVIDTAKTIAVASLYDNDAWDLFTGKLKPTKALPIITVLTLSATGSEMNCFAVIQNQKEELKASFTSSYVYPLMSFLDPTYTFSVSKEYTAYGLADLCAHATEAFFGEGDSPLSDRFVASIIKEAITIGPALLMDLNSYDLRARMMYASTMALNNLTTYGRVSGDWGVHAVGHELSLLYDIPHGASLSVVYPAWLKLQTDRIKDRISRFGILVFDTGVVKDVIKRVEDMFVLFECPINLNQLKIPNFNDDKFIFNLEKNNVSGYAHKLEFEDYFVLLNYMKG
jgi:alcohol dehydrogenase YqhD (iron-dependent ADH family)